MALVRVRNSNGVEFEVDERIQQGFPDDFVLVDGPRRAAAPPAPQPAPQPQRDLGYGAPGR